MTPKESHQAIGPVFKTEKIELYLTDCFDWLCEREANSIHAVVTDPPYGYIEFTEAHLAKRENGKGGVWRIPPKFDGYQRSPLPRFTVQTREELEGMSGFFTEWASRVFRVLVPGGHVIIATNPLMADRLYASILSAGFEKRGEIVRLVTTLRGGDRPKNAEAEFPQVSVLPKSRYEPWGLFRKPLDGRVVDNLRKWKTGGLRRIDNEQPFGDVITCPPALPEERKIAPHPSLKPQRLMRQLVRASLPLGEGIVLDPFAGSGSTLAAAEAIGYQCIGLESNPEYVSIAVKAIPLLAMLNVNRDKQMVFSGL